MKKRLLLDVDEVICFSGFLPIINEFLNTNFIIDDFQDYYIDDVVIPKERFKEFNDFLRTKNLYEKAHILPNAIEVIEKLNEIYDIYICSSCINPFDIEGSGKNFLDKFNFLYKNLPFINPEKYIFTNSKNMFKADIQIDDRLSHLQNNIGIKILFPSYHNKDISLENLKKYNIVKAGNDWKNGWNEVEKILIKKYKN